MIKGPTEQQASKLISKLGQKKFDDFMKKIAEHNANQAIENQRKHELELERMAMMVPKENLIDGVYYVGYCETGDSIAVWDKKENTFYMMNWKHAWRIVKMPYFLDVYETRFDGFMPFKTIDKVEI